MKNKQLNLYIYKKKNRQSISPTAATWKGPKWYCNNLASLITSRIALVFSSLTLLESQRQQNKSALNHL